MTIGITIAGPTLENRTGWEADLHQSRDERLGRADSGRSPKWVPLRSSTDNEPLSRRAHKSEVPTASEATGEMVGGARQFGLRIRSLFNLAIEPAGQSGADLRKRVRRARSRELGNPAAGEQDPH
jgi:hypothetical protein